MKLDIKDFSTPRAMLNTRVYRCVIDFLNQCEFYQLFPGDLEPSEKRWLVLIKRCIDSLNETAPDFGGTMKKCLLAYVKLLPKIQKLLKQ